MVNDDPKHNRLRTWLCSVVFVDICGYSKQSVDAQMAWKTRFMGYVADSVRETPEADRVMLDTGDGAAICFLGDPEAAMFCGLKLLDAMLHEEPKQENPMRSRIGINLGSVKLVTNITGNLNPVGDGINVAQRVMSFAGDNRVLVSRSFYEVVSVISDSYRQLFRFEGVRKDKHVREHTLYNLVPPGSDGAPGDVAACEAATAGIDWDPGHLETVRQQLALYMGPMARVLVARTSSAARSLAELYERLASEIPSEADREQFLRGLAPPPVRRAQ
jgi:class 3 adenylate cyclase